MGSAVFASIAGSVASSALSRKGESKAGRIANTILPTTINTGRSTYKTRTGKFNLNPSIRQGQEESRLNIRNLTVPANAAFDEFSSGIRDVRMNLSELADDYIGNQSVFRESQLAPLQENIAKAEGNLDRELQRTNVRGTFANLSRSGLALDSARELRNAEAQIENDRINALGDFLQIDADLLKQGLVSETGRVGMLAELEGIISGMDANQFEQEMRLLGLPGTLSGATSKQADIRANAAGVAGQADANLVGDIIGGMGNGSGPSGSSGAGAGVGGAGGGPHGGGY